MKTKITVADVQRIGGCQSGLDRAIALGARVGIPADAEVDFDFVIQTCEENNDTFLKRYFLMNKAALLEYTNAEFSCFVVLGQEYLNLEDARVASNLIKNERIANRKSLTVVNFSKSLGEDQEWIAIDLDSFAIPENVSEFHFHVFNHKTGVYHECLTLDDAKNVRDELVASFSTEDASSWNIFKRYIYAEDGVSTKDEVVE